MIMSDTKEVEHTKCKGCKCYRANNLFLNAKRRRLKSCLSCRNRHKCSKCDYKCGSNADLQKHIKAVHDKIKDFKCNKCDYECSGNSNLQKHIKMVHDKIKDVKCPKCDYACSTNGHIQTHIKMVHDKTKDVKCQKCDYACSTNGHLQKHIKQVHDKIKDHKCDKCEYACSTNESLQTHIKTCTGKLKCSSGEYQIMKTLDEMRMPYEHDQSYELKNDDDNWLRWDFIIQTTGDPIFIEYDGKQHFKPVNFGGMSNEKAQKSFEKQKKHDKLKNDYCNDNCYLLLRIPYTEYENIHSLVVAFIRDNTDWGAE